MENLPKDIASGLAHLELLDGDGPLDQLVTATADILSRTEGSPSAEKLVGTRALAFRLYIFSSTERWVLTNAVAYARCGLASGALEDDRSCACGERVVRSHVHGAH